MKKIYLLFICVLSVSILTAQKIPFQGRLLDNGKPYNGSATLEFSITTPSWSETKTGINVTDGYYSVILGETTPLPDALFNNSPEVEMSITVNGEALSPVTLYSPLLPHTGPQGIEVDTLKAFMAEAIGVNDEGKARITTTNGGYDGVMSLTDSLGRTGSFMRTRKIGGYLQLAQQNFTDDSFSSAAVMGSNEKNSFSQIYGRNIADDGIESMVLVYGSDNDLDGPIPDGYRRGGIDIGNYFGNLTHNIFSEHVGTSTISHINLNASQDDGGPQFTLNMNSGDGVSTGGNISLRDAGETETIFLDGSSGTIDAQQILINGSPIEGSGGGTATPDSVKTKSVQVLGNAGEVKADLNFFDSNNSGSLVLNGANDSTKVILGSISGGYGGFLGLYDSTRNIGAQIRVTNKGVGNLFTRNEAHNAAGWFGGIGNDGFMQLISYDDTEAVSGAALVGSFIDGSLPEFYIEGSAQENFGLGRFRVTPLGNSSEETAMLEINRTNGGGQAIMTIVQDDGGSDAAGSSGQIDLFGDESVNIQLGSQSFADHDLSVINMYGSIDDGGGWWYNTSQLNSTRTSDGSQEYGDLIIFKNEAGSNLTTARLTGSYDEQGGGGLELLDSLGNLKIAANANEGSINMQDEAGNFRGSLTTAGVSNRGPDTEINTWLGNNWLDGGSENSNRGALLLFGDVATRTALNGTDIRRIELRVADDGFGNDIGKLSLRGPIEGDNLLVDLGGSTDDGTSYGANLTLNNTGSGAALMTSNLNGTQAGGIELLDNSGTATIIMDGSTGTINAEQVLVQGVPIGSGGSGNISPDTITTSSIRALNGAGNEGVYLQGNTEGGTLQISSPDATNAYNRATFFAGTTTNGENSFANLYGMNPTGDGQELLINNYTTINDVFGSPFTGGYRRGGTDYFDNEGTFLAGIGSNRDDTGGKSGLVLVNTDVTRNAYLSGKWWENADLGILQIFGQNDDGTGLNGTLAVAELQAVDQAGNTSANLALFNTDAGGSAIETFLIQSDNGGGSSIVMRDNLGDTTIHLDGSTGTVTAPIIDSPSDRRLKKNIQTLTNPLDNTLKMRGVSYEWKDQSKSQKNQIGVIAQEVEAIYPEFVRTNEKGMKSVNYAQMTAVLIEAIKELNAKVEKLESENSTLKASLSEVETLKKQMDQLMEMLGSSKAASK